jgi:DNA polymerase-1
MTAEKDSLFLIDGYALIYRSYFAFIKNPLRTAKGENTGAVYGFTNALLRILEQYRPSRWAVVLDTAEPTFRHRLFPEYKATREKMPEELEEQIPRIREVLSALRIPVLELEGFEADDVIGTLSRRASDEGDRVVIVSGDKDFCQLVDEDVVLLNPGSRNREDEWVDREGVEARLGVPPERVVDLLALMGDSSDNVPGVPGIGRKTAEKLIRAHGGLQEIYDALDEVASKKMAERLATHRESAFLSRDLVRLDVDAPVEVPIDSLRREEPDEEAVERLFRELEFFSLLPDRDPAVESPASTGRYRAVTDPDELAAFLREARDAGRLCFDVETTSLDPIEADLVGIALAVAEGEAIYVPLAHRNGPTLDREKALELLRPVLESPDVEKIGQNLKYDLSVLRRAGIRPAALSFDTMVASYLLEPDRKSHGLDFLAMEFLGHRMIPFAEVVTERDATFADVPLEEAVRYACEDADITLRLANRFEGMLEEKKLLSLFRDVEVPLVEVLADMEAVGVAIDRAFFERMSAEMERDLERLQADIYALAGEEFNINSHPQLSRVLFETLKLPPLKRTKTGYSTDSEVLERLAEEHEIPRRLLEYRELSKLRSTYVDALPRQIHPRTGRIHTSFNQVVTSTGRLSSSGPNLQNIPVRTAIGREIRRGFVPADDDHVLLSCDYSQIELRIMAHLSGDEEMVRAFLSGEDIHRQTAALVFDIPYEKVPDELRYRAKEVNFGIIYGMGAFGLARRLRMSIEEAGAFIEGYFRRFRGVKAFIDRVIEDAERDGYVTTIMGRRRYLPGLEDRRRSVREFARRTAINSPIQGSAADIIKVAMIDVRNELERRGAGARMIMQVHDELVLEVPRSEQEEITEMVREKMEGAIVLRVPVTVDARTGNSWYECKEGA